MCGALRLSFKNAGKPDKQVRSHRGDLYSDRFYVVFRSCESRRKLRIDREPAAASEQKRDEDDDVEHRKLRVAMRKHILRDCHAKCYSKQCCIYTSEAAGDQEKRADELDECRSKS
ncbi:MAG: hypothetical protein QOH31_5240 [Verrucomicrobiota bacterium]|jgi:hypothetical protein